MANYTPLVSGTDVRDPLVAATNTTSIPTLDRPEQVKELTKVSEEFPLSAIKEYDKLQENVIDGDTIRGDYFGTKNNVRLKGFNAPEMPNKEYNDQTYVDASLAGTMTPEQKVGWKAKQDLVSSLFEMQKVAGLQDAKERKLKLLTDGYDATNSRLLGDVYATEGNKVTDTLSTEMLAKGDSNVWFEKNDPNRGVKTDIEKQIIDAALSKAQNTNSDEDWASYENLVQRSGLTPNEKAVYLDPKVQIAKPLANAVIGAGEMFSKAGNYAMEMLGKAPELLYGRYSPGKGWIQTENDKAIEGALKPYSDKLAAVTKSPSTKEIEAAFDPIRNSLDETFNTTVFSRLRPAEVPSVAKALHDMDQGRNMAAAVGIANSVINGLVNEENAAMLVPFFGQAGLVLGKAKEFKDDGAGDAKALVYGATYAALNKLGFDASVGQIKNLGKLAAGKFLGHAAVEEATENLQSLIELDAAGKINSMQDVVKSLKDTSREVAPSAIFGGTSAVARDVVKTDALQAKIKEGLEALKSTKEASTTSGNAPTTSNLSADLDVLEAGIDKPLTADYKMKMMQVIDNAVKSGDEAALARLQALNTRYRDIVAKTTEAARQPSGTLSMKVMGSNPAVLQEYFDAIRDAKSEEERSKMVDDLLGDPELTSADGYNMSQEQLQKYADALKNGEDVSKDFTSLEATNEDIMFKGFATPSNVYIPMKEVFTRASTGDRSALTQAQQFVGLQTQKADSLNEGLASAKAEGLTLAEQLSNGKNLDVDTTLKALAYFTGRTVGLKGQEVVPYIRAAKALGEAYGASTEDLKDLNSLKSWYTGSAIDKEMKRKVDVQYANPFLSRNLGKFEINMFEIVSELAQDRDAKAKLKETGIRKTIDAVNTETEQIRSMLDKVHNRAMLMDEMLKVFTGKQPDETTTITKDSEQIEKSEDATKADKFVLEPKDSKTATKKSFEVKARILTKPETVKTVIDGKVETTKQGNIGDYVLTGPKGEKYTVEAKKVKDRYSETTNPDGTVTLKTKPVSIKYSISDKDFTFTASWGEKMIAEVGDALVYENGKLSYRIEKEIFKDTYEPEEVAKETVEEVKPSVTKEKSKLDTIKNNLNKLDKSDKKKLEKVERYFSGVEKLTASRTATANKWVDELFAKANAPKKEHAQREKLKAAAKSMQTDEDKAAKDVKAVMTSEKNEVEKAKDLSEADVKELERKHEEETNAQYEEFSKEVYRLLAEEEIAKANEGKVGKPMPAVTAASLGAKQAAEFVASVKNDANKIREEFLKAKVAFNTAIKNVKNLREELKYALEDEKAAVEEDLRKAIDTKNTARGYKIELNEHLKELQNKNAKSKLAEKTDNINYSKAGVSKAQEKVTKALGDIEVKPPVVSVLKTRNTEEPLAMSKAEDLMKSANDDAQGLMAQVVEDVAKLSPVSGEKYDAFIASQLAYAVPLLFDSKKSGKEAVNKDTALALYMATMEEIDNASSSLLDVDNEDLATIWGVNVENMDDTQIAKLRELGIPAKSLAFKIGRTAMKMLGYSAESEQKELYEHLTGSLGVYGLKLAENYKMLQKSTMTAAEIARLIGKKEAEVQQVIKSGGENAVPYLIKGAKGSGVKAAEMYKDVNQYVKRSDDLKSDVKFKPSSESKFDGSIRRNEVSKASDELVEAQHKFSKQKWHMKGVETEGAMREVFEMGEYSLKRLMGWKTEEELAKVSKYRRDGLVSANKGIERSVRSLYRVYDKLKNNEELNEMYFDWFIAKSYRLMIDSAGFNPQLDKLHRHIVYAPDSKVTVDKSDKKMMSNFKVAVAQALGFKTDGEAISKSEEFADKFLSEDGAKLLRMAWDDYKKEIKNGEPTRAFTANGVKIEVDVVSQFLDALEAVETYVKSDDKFETTITMESDGVTNGFALKLMQYSYGLDEKLGESTKNTIKDLMAKVGVSVGSTPEKEFAARKKGLVDMYKTLASNMTNEGLLLGVAEDKAELASSFLNALDPVIDSKGEVTSWGRELFKPPFMTFNYGAGWNKIKSEMAEAVIDKFMQKLEKTGEDAKMEKFMQLLLGNDKSFKENKKLLMSKDLSEVYSGEDTVLDSLKTLIVNTYGNTAENIMKNEFSYMEEVNGAIINGMKAVHAVWESKFRNEISKLDGITIDALDKIYEKLLPEFPIIEDAFGNKEKGIALFKTELAKRVDLKGDAVTSKIAGSKYGRIGAQVKGEVTNVDKLVNMYVEAASAAAVIPIHALDAAIMTSAVKDMGVIEIHDAIMTGIGTMEDAVKEYNKKFFEMSLSWNYAEAVYNKAVETLNKEGTESILRKALSKKDYESVLEGISTLKSVVEGSKIARRELLENDVTVEQMVYNKDSAYKYKAMSLSDDVNKQLEALGLTKIEGCH